MKSSAIALFALTLLTATTVAAEPIDATFGLGARVGGYGFRQVQQQGFDWDACRMNGTGLFGTVDLGQHFFGELSADFYHSIENSWDMDRVSFFPAAAVGARIFPGKLITPYLQAGGGPEFTRIDLGGATANQVLPTAFMGIGGELNIKSFHVGTNLRVFTMGLPVYETPEQKTAESYYYPNNIAEPADDEIEMRNEVAAQMQFFARYTF